VPQVVGQVAHVAVHLMLLLGLHSAVDLALWLVLQFVLHLLLQPRSAAQFAPKSEALPRLATKFVLHSVQQTWAPERP